MLLLPVVEVDVAVNNNVRDKAKTCGVDVEVVVDVDVDVDARINMINSDVVVGARVDVDANGQIDGDVVGISNDVIVDPTLEYAYASFDVDVSVGVAVVTSKSLLRSVVFMSTRTERVKSVGRYGTRCWNFARTLKGDWRLQFSRILSRRIRAEHCWRVNAYTVPTDRVRS